MDSKDTKKHTLDPTKGDGDFNFRPLKHVHLRERQLVPHGIVKCWHWTILKFFINFHDPIIKLLVLFIY